MKDYWKNINKIKPKLGQKILVYCKKINSFGDKFIDYYVVVYGVNFYDKRKKCFYEQTAFYYDYHYNENKEDFTSKSAWKYEDVKYWQELIPPIY